MNVFYNLMIKESLNREDVEALEKDNYKNSHEILQMFRESNAMAAKVNDVELAHVIVDVKADVDRLREQIQNLE